MTKPNIIIGKEVNITKVNFQDVRKPTANPESISQNIKMICPNLSPIPNSICSNCV